MTQEEVNEPAIFMIPYFIGDVEPGLDLIAEADWNIIELGAAEDISLTPDGRLHRMSMLYSELAASVTKAIRNGYVPVSISGDCLSSIGMFTGLQQAGIDPLLAIKTF